MKIIVLLVGIIIYAVSVCIILFVLMLLLIAIGETYRKKYK